MSFQPSQWPHTCQATMQQAEDRHDGHRAGEDAVEGLVRARLDVVDAGAVPRARRWRSWLGEASGTACDGDHAAATLIVRAAILPLVRFLSLKALRWRGWGQSNLPTAQRGRPHAARRSSPMSSTFADLGVSEAVAGALAKRGIETPFAVQSMVIPDVLAGRDVLVKSPTGSGKTLAFGVPLADRVDARRRLRRPPSSSRRRASSPAQIVDELAGVMRARAAHDRRRLRRRRHPRPGQARAARRRARRHARPPARPDRAPRRLARRRSRCSCSTRPTGCSTWASSPSSTGSSRMTPRDRQTLLFSATLEGEVGRIARARTRATRVATSTRRRPRARPTSSTASCASRTRRRSRRSCDRARRARAAAARSSSCAPSAAPTGSSSSSPRTTSRPSRCTATSRRRSASARSPASRPAASTRSSRPTSPRAGSTSPASRTSSTSTRPAAREDYVHRIGRTAPRRRQRRRHHVRARRPGARHGQDRAPSSASPGTASRGTRAAARAPRGDVRRPAGGGAAGGGRRDRAVNRA